MADTEADHVEQTIRKLQSGALGSSSDVETFCTPSLKLLLSTEATWVTLHDDLLQFRECGKGCELCRYLYASFGEEPEEAKERSETGRGPKVTATIGSYHIGEESKLVERAKLTVSFSEPYPGNYYFRYFVVLSNGGT
jgi:hypothetical protein